MSNRNSCRKSATTGVSSMSGVSGVEDVTDVTMSRIRRSDATSMLLRKVDKNERPYTQAVLKANNDIVNEWDQQVLSKICDSDGAIQTIKIQKSLSGFIEAREIENYMKHMSHLPTITEEHLNYWINLFRSHSIEELHNIGSFTVSMGWNVIKGAVQAYYAQEKWKLVYNVDATPAERLRLMSKHHSLFSCDTLPYGLDNEEMKDIAIKVQTLLNIRIEPQQ